MSRIPLVALVLLLLASPALAQEGAPEDADTDASGESEIHARINAMRIAASLAPLERDERLDAAARTHSADMAWHAMLDHVSPRTGDPSARARAAGVTATVLAENIAMAGDPIEAHRRLVASEAHRANILSPRYTHIGISVVESESGVYVTEVFAQLEPPAGEEPTPEVAPPAPEPPPVVGPPELAPDVDVEIEAGAQDGAAEEAPLPDDAPVVRVPQPGERRVAGYWVHAQGRWWYYPLPPDARPGQVLTPDPNVTGPPPPTASYRHPRYHVYRAPIAAPPRTVYIQPRGRVYSGPPPAFGWSPRRQYWRWQNAR